MVRQQRLLLHATFKYLLFTANSKRNWILLVSPGWHTQSYDKNKHGNFFQWYQVTSKISRSINTKLLSLFKMWHVSEYSHKSKRAENDYYKWNQCCFSTDSSKYYTKIWSPVRRMYWINIFLIPRWKIYIKKEKKVVELCF